VGEDIPESKLVTRSTCSSGNTRYNSAQTESAVLQFAIEKHEH